MDIQQIIQELQKHQLLPGKVDYKPLTGGKVSRLYLINNELVVKCNQPLTLKWNQPFWRCIKKLNACQEFIILTLIFIFLYIPLSREKQVRG